MGTLDGNGYSGDYQRHCDQGVDGDSGAHIGRYGDGERGDLDGDGAGDGPGISRGVGGWG